MPGHGRGIFKKWFWNTYDYLGILIVVNLLWIVCAVSVIALPIGMLGLFRVTNRIAAYEETGIRDFFTGLRTDIPRSLRLCGVFAGVWLLLLVNVLFYMRMMAVWPWAGAILSGAMIWLTLFTGLIGMFCFPLLERENMPVRQIIKTGAFMAVDNAKTTIGLFLTVLAVVTVGLVSGAGMLFIAVSAVAVLCSTALRELQKQYDASEADISSEVEEPRGWRDLIRPWEYQ